MFSPSHLKALQHPLQVFSVKSPSSSSTLSSMKLKSLIHTLIISQVCRIIRALSKVKVIIVEILKKNQPINFFHPSQKKHNKKQRKIFLGSFRFHYNWCSSSSHIMPVPARVYEGLLPSGGGGATHLYYDSTWNTVIPADQNHGEDFHDSQLAGYLQWLEEKADEEGTNEKEINEIDMLAEMFIANSHEKFLLEKQESDRRFQDMLARSM
ncbi:hypothetical protein L6164_009446 [Bauhinia variegata]|uniref:Uncharacterized protein n=1 Tax=Bauhinia variegata TaxID=167791 RepID=A0ACB9PIR3_BAUVA|nr:hypothetical protein L6164_009446 [Bauhinia variegata]